MPLPTGPLAMACFLGAVVYLELVMGQQVPPNSQQRFDRARFMCAASLGVAIAEKSYGPEHPNIARHLNNLAELSTTKADTPRPSRFIGGRW